MNPNSTAIQKERFSQSDVGISLSTSQVKHAPRSFGLDLARTIAISLVLASHFAHNALDSLGFWGVELFFALSGFLIGQILWRNFSRTDNWTKAQIVNFWQRRWWRTLPNYYLFFAVLLILALLNKEEIPSLGNLSKFIWFGQSLFSRDWGFYSVSWSLCIEEWFYLVFPLLLFGFSLVINNRKASFSLALVAIFLGSIIIRGILATQSPTADLRGITLARLDAIACGVLISFLTAIYSIPSKQRIFALTIGIIFQICAVAYLNTTDLAHIIRSQVFLVLVPLGFALMMPYFSSISVSTKSPKFISDIVEKISLWSYSIYLSHAPIMWLSYSLLEKYRNSFYGNLLSKSIGLLLTLVVSASLYNFFEVPFTKKRPKELK